MLNPQTNNTGFTLIELMISVAIIAILAIIAVPNFVAYRNRATITTAIGSSEAIRSAMAAYAVDSQGNRFAVDEFEDGPAGWEDLRRFMSPLGTTLKENMRKQGYSDFIYRTSSLDGEDGVDYFFIFRTAGTQPILPGALLEVRPSGISRWTGTL